MRVKAIFTVPNLRNPTIVTMSLERRMALADIARRHHNLTSHPACMFV